MTAELRHLRGFVAIAEERNLTRAAARLHLTQPALTRTLQQLEKHLGVRLVERSTHHLELTAAGRVFLGRARVALSAVDDALDPGRAGTWPLRLGHAWSALGRHTTPVLRRWAAEHPDVPLELVRHDDRSAGLDRGAVDAALRRDPEPAPDMRTALLYDEERWAVLPDDSHLAARDRLSLADLATRPVVWNSVSGSTTSRLWPADAQPPRFLPVATTDDWLSIIAAGGGVGVTTAATTVLHAYPGVTYRPLTDAPRVGVYLTWREPPGHPGVADLLELIRAVVGED
ncbi:MAG: LysR substrate-binding domain-containing protein [Pseudonocardia sp.]|nr:LysR substrate-binding domain-containing protein [Pseudonocardia sp.]